MEAIMLDRSSIRKRNIRRFIDQWVTDGAPLGPRRKIRNNPREGDMTICVAALANGGTTVFGASDRLLAAEELTSEPEQTKQAKISDSIALMVAAEDLTFPMDVIHQVQLHFGEILKNDPKKILKVKDV